MKLVIFDLDGTLIDSAADIAHSANEVRATEGLPALAVEVIAGYVGDGVKKLLERALPGASPSRVDAAYDDYLPIYRRRLLENTVPYPGVTEALDELTAKGHRLAVLTNKPIRESVAILEGLDLYGYFDAVYGGDSFARRKPDPVGVRHLLDEVGASADETWFVGDTLVDYQTARNASVRCCLVTYGLVPSRIRPAEPDLRVDDLRELAHHLPEATFP